MPSRKHWQLPVLFIYTWIFYLSNRCDWYFIYQILIPQFIYTWILYLSNRCPKTTGPSTLPHPILFIYTWILYLSNRCDCSCPKITTRPSSIKSAEALNYNNRGACCWSAVQFSPQWYWKCYYCWGNALLILIIIFSLKTVILVYSALYHFCPISFDWW